MLLAMFLTRAAAASPVGGGELGVGAMTESGTPCRVQCSYGELAPQLDLHIGTRESERVTLLLDVSLTAHTVMSPYFETDAFVLQGTAMPALRYTVAPPLWVEAGAGLAKHVSGNHTGELELGNGVAMMGSVGVALPASRAVAIEVQARVALGLYDGGDAHTIAATFGVGLDVQ